MAFSTPDSILPATMLAGRPSFLAYDAMSYLVFFPADDPLGRDFEWWNGALVTRQKGQ